jgi:hypothetical protein
LADYYSAPLLFALAYTTNLSLAVLLLIAIGAAGGWFIVPLNAALQHHGQAHMGTGRALAVQNLWENLAMFVAVSLYGLVIGSVDVISLIVLLSLLLGAILIALTLNLARKQTTPA